MLPLPSAEPLRAGRPALTGYDGSVTLRVLSLTDAPLFADHIAGDLERLSRFLPWPALTDTEDGAESWIGAYHSQLEGRVIAIGAFEDDEDMLGGAVLFHHDPASAIVELGVWVTAEAEGRGVAGACCRALLELARADLGAERVEWRAASLNRLSVGLAERLGFHREGTLRSACLLRGERLDIELLSMVGAELDSSPSP